MGSLLSLPRPSPQHSSVDDLDDEALYDLIKNRKQAEGLGSMNAVFRTAYRITPDAVLKVIQSNSEVFMMNYVASRTTISIPKIRRVLPNQEDEDDPGWLIMDYIEGEELHDAWPKLSLWMKLRTLWSFWSYIRQLHRLPLPFPGIPGPFNETGQPQVCQGRLFTEDGAGPFESYAEMADWFDRRRHDCFAYDFLRAKGKLTGHRIPIFDRSYPLVLCHMDLHRHNLMIEKSTGRLWVLDWAFAGAYPPWFEYVIGYDLDAPGGLRKRQPDLWDWASRFILGNYERLRTGYFDAMKLVRIIQDGRPISPNFFHSRGLVIEDDQVKYAPKL
ncbi:kinase-like protein [Coprinopsis sp. MPI-PUGE-AT-0042]|nr:kinase-like protein [Coprinopsis sp. MPI-PUGE-AT-0042]